MSLITTWSPVNVSLPGASANMAVASETTSETASAGRGYRLRDRVMRLERMCLQMVMAIALGGIEVNEHNKILSEN
jgi:hypothetical protein